MGELFEFLEKPELWEDEPVGVETLSKARKIRTSELVGRLFIPPDKLSITSEEDKLTPRVEWRLVIDVGLMGSGKTTLALTVGRKMEEYYHGYRVYTILSDDLISAVKKIPGDAEIIYIIIDDAPIRHLAAQRIREDVYTIGAFFRIRHLALKMAPNTLYVAMMFNTQRFKSLDVVFRGFANIIVYKTVLGDVREQEELKKYLGSIPYRFLLGITEAIYSYHMPEYKQFYVYRTLGGGKGLAYLDLIAKPRNLIVVESIHKIDDFLLKHEKVELKKLAENVLKAAGMLDMPWTWVRDNLLPTLREMGLKIGQQKAYDIYKRAREYARTLSETELLEEVEETKEVG